MALIVTVFVIMCVTVVGMVVRRGLVRVMVVMVRGVMALRSCFELGEPHAQDVRPGKGLLAKAIAYGRHTHARLFKDGCTGEQGSACGRDQLGARVKGDDRGLLFG